MKKEKFITVMAIFDDSTQKVLQSIQDELEQRYGVDTKTKNIPFHITLGSYAVEETEKIVSRIMDIAGKTKSFGVSFTGLSHFGNVVRFVEPVISEELSTLHMHFDSDYANGFETWKPHVTVYRHSEPKEVEISPSVIDKLENLTDARIVGIELGEFFPAKKIVRVIFSE